MPSIPASVRQYRFQTLNPVVPETIDGSVSAAYFTAEGDFTLFKDEKHAVVLAIRNEFLVLVERTR